VNGTFDHDGNARFGRNGSEFFVINRSSLEPIQVAFKMDPISPGTDKITGELSDPGHQVVATINADRALYTADSNPVSPFMNVPSALRDPGAEKGKYTVIFQSRTPEEQGPGVSVFPQGDGWALLEISTAGVARAAGRLSDGSPFLCARPLSKANEWSMYAPLYAGKGCIAGLVKFADEPGVSDAAGVDVRWFKPATSNAGIYPDGWIDGILVDCFASKYLRPVEGSGTNVLQIAGASSPTVNNVLVSLADALMADPLESAASMNAASAISNFSSGPGSAENFKLVVNVATGTFAGSFSYPILNIPMTSFNGVIFQKQNFGSGYFLGGPAGTRRQSGFVSIEPLQ
jgi:hypothetical protein